MNEEEGAKGPAEEGGPPEQDPPPQDPPPQGPPYEQTHPDFGVKSYIHQFYEKVAVSNPADYEEFAGLHKKKGRCSSTACWRVGVWVGMNLLVFGIVAILVGYLVPQRVVVNKLYGDIEVVDHAAQQYNNNLDICKMVGLSVFCLGGLVLTFTLLVPSFTSHCRDDDATILLPAGPEYVVTHLSMPVPAGLDTTTEVEEPRSPTERQVPATEKVKGVQPKRKDKEALMTSSAGTFSMAKKP